jgi:hypothetical protein
MHNFLDIIDRTKNGNKINENEYGMRIFHRYDKLIKKIILNNTKSCFKK